MAADRGTDTAEFISDLDAGALERKLALALNKIGLAVTEHTRKGKLTLEFTFERIGNSSMVNVKHGIKMTAPTARGSIIEQDNGTTPMHVGGGGKLSFFPDKQQALFGKSDSDD